MMPETLPQAGDAMTHPLRTAYEYLVLYVAVGVLAALSLSWSACALLLYPLLPERLGTAVGRRVIMGGFRAYTWLLRACGAYRLDLEPMSALATVPPMILAANHPSLIDAPLILAHHPNIACVMKSTLIKSPLFGAGARLARYVKNDPPRQMIRESVEHLHRGGLLLLFPEGTRTVDAPINALAAGVGAIARRAGVPVQTLLIETDSAFLGKAWPWYRRARLPITYRIRLGRRFPPPTDAGAFTAELEAYFREALSAQCTARPRTSS